MRRCAVTAAVRLGIALVGMTALADGDVGEWRHGISFFGDFKYPPGFPHFDHVNPNAPKGGRLVLPVGTFNSFTTFIAKGLGAPGIGVIGQMTLYDPLMWPSDDEVGVYYGNLAEQIAISPDSTQLRMRLREEAHWHDGVPVTARDVAFTLAHIKANAFQGVKAAFASIKRVEVVGEREVLFTYGSPVNKNAMTALGKIAMLPEHYWRTRDSSRTTIEPPLSSGPYRIGKFEIGKYIELERVPDYWGADLGLHRGRHNIDILRYEVYRDATVRREALRKGLLDYFEEPSAAQWVTGYDSASFRGLLVKKPNVFRQYTGTVRALGFNLTRERFADVRVREALTLAFDLEWINRVQDFGVYETPESFFHRTFLAATGLPSTAERALLEPFRDALPERVFTQAPFLGSELARMSDRDRLARAQALLEEAGWELRDDVLVDSKGEAFAIEFLITGAMGQRQLLPYVERLRRLGIVGTIRMVESAQYVNLRRQNKTDAVFGSLAISVPPNQELPAYFSSYSFGTANFARVDSPVVDDLVERVLKAPTRRDLVAASRALDRVLYWQFYFIPLRVVEPSRSVFWDRYGYPEKPGEYRSGFPDTWWWDEAKAQRVAEIRGGR